LIGVFPLNASTDGGLPEYFPWGDEL